MSHSCSYTGPRTTRGEDPPCPTPASHVLYVDRLDSNGDLDPSDEAVAYACTRHGGSVVGEFLFDARNVQIVLAPIYEFGEGE